MACIGMPHAVGLEQNTQRIVVVLSVSTEFEQRPSNKTINSNNQAQTEHSAPT